MSTFSPELALVDPDLAARARSALPHPPDCLRQRALAPPSAPERSEPREPRMVRIGVSAVAPATTVRHDEGAGERVRAHRIARPSLAGVVGLVLMALVIGSPAFDLIPPGTAGPSFVAETPRSEDQGSAGPVGGGSSATMLRWPATPGADYYDVVLWRDGRRELDLWPTGTTLSIDSSVSVDGERLRPGRYAWFVFPAFEEPSGVRLGAEIAHGELVIDSAGAP